jgi:hypothetical protein
MKLFSRQITHFTLSWLIVLGLLPLVQPSAPPTPTTMPLNIVQLRVLLRTAAGQPVTGVVVDLIPAAPELGGPPVGTPAKGGQTDAAGAALFDALQGAIWKVRFTGRYAGQLLQPPTEQGQSPYGTTQGNGFVVQTSLHEENDAPAPVMGVPAPLAETLAFVLLSTNGRWTPEIDLAAPSDPPQPLNMLAQTPARPMFYDPASLAPAGDPPPSEPRSEDERETATDGGFTALWLVPAIAAGAALWRVWCSRRAREHRGLAGGESAAKSPRGVE